MKFQASVKSWTDEKYSKVFHTVNVGGMIVGLLLLFSLPGYWNWTAWVSWELALNAYIYSLNKARHVREVSA